MIVTFQGYNGKKNKATAVVSAIAAMTAVAYREKTLVIQLTEADISCVENMYTGKGLKGLHSFRDDELDFSDDGIDALLRTVDATKLMKEDFDAMCIPIFNSENLLDVAGQTKTQMFTENLTTKMEQIYNLLNNAKDVYEHIFILLPSDNEKISQAINGLKIVDKSVYCLTQGFGNKAPVYGNAITYVISDYEDHSNFSLTGTKKAFISMGSKEKMFKISHCVGFMDAYKSGTLIRFAMKNRDLQREDINYKWSQDVKSIVCSLLEKSFKDTEINEEWEKCEFIMPELKNADATEEVMDAVNEELSSAVELNENDMLAESAEELIANNIKTFEELTLKVVEASEKRETSENVSVLEVAKEVKEPKSKKGLFNFGKKKDIPQNEQVNYEEFHEEEEELDFEKMSQDFIFEPGEFEGIQLKEIWDCPNCNCKCEGKFCMECGEKKPAPKKVEPWVCKDCGYEQEGKFCMNCGLKKPDVKKKVFCPECGAEAKGKFCMECGTSVQ